MKHIHWKKQVDPHDYKAAESYLSLLWSAPRAEVEVGELRRAKLTTRRANDILRACRRDPLPLNDPGVRRDAEKVEAGRKLSPVLVVSLSDGAEIADGFHRVSLAYHRDPFGDVPLKIGDTDWPNLQSALRRIDE